MYTLTINQSINQSLAVATDTMKTTTESSHHLQHCALPDKSATVIRRLIESFPTVLLLADDNDANDDARSNNDQPDNDEQD